MNLRLTVSKDGRRPGAELFARTHHILICLVVVFHLTLPRPESVFGQRDVWLEQFEIFEKLMMDGRYSEAHIAGEKSIEIAQEAFPKGSEQLARALSLVALEYMKKRIYIEAEPILEKAMPHIEKVWGKNHHAYALHLAALGTVYAKNGKYTQGKSLMMEALEIQRSTLGEEDPDIGAHLHNLGVLCEWQSQHAEAEHFYLQALRIKEKNLGLRHPDLINTLEGLRDVYRKQGLPARALKYEARVRDILSVHHDKKETPQE